MASCNRLSSHDWGTTDATTKSRAASSCRWGQRRLGVGCSGKIRWMDPSGGGGCAHGPRLSWRPGYYVDLDGARNRPPAFWHPGNVGGPIRPWAGTNRQSDQRFRPPVHGNNAILREHAGNNKHRGDEPQARHARAIAGTWRHGKTTPRSRAVPAPALPDGWARERPAEQEWETA